MGLLSDNETVIVINVSDVTIVSGYNATRNQYFKPNLLFVKNFHGVVLFVRFMLHQHYSTEGPSTQGLDSVKVIQARCILKQKEIEFTIKF